MPIEITDEMIERFRLNHEPANEEEQPDIRSGLAAVLAMPETRQAVLAEVERQHEAMMAALPDWDEMSDLDKGAALMHIWKRDNEGDDYAVENYPAKFIEDPRLNALDRADACAHAARFEERSEELQEESSDEWSRLYDLALNHERSN